MSTIFLVRHGEVEGNMGARRTFVGWGDKPLTARGEAQAVAVAARLKRERLDAVYSSDLQRARYTAERIASEHGLKVCCTPALREMDYGEWEGLSESELLADWGEHWERRSADPINVAAPGGESYAAVWERLQPVWQSIIERHRSESVAIVGHNGTTRILLCYLLGAPFQNFKRIEVSNGGLSRVEINFDVQNTAAPPYVLVSYSNETCHLEHLENV